MQKRTRRATAVPTSHAEMTPGQSQLFNQIVRADGPFYVDKARNRTAKQLEEGGFISRLSADRAPPRHAQTAFHLA